MIERTEPPQSAEEIATLRGFLTYHRQTLLLKADGLDADQLNRAHPPSTMTLGGMLKHLAYVEHHWFAAVLLGREAAEPWASVDWDADPDWEWRTAGTDSPERLRSLLLDSIARSDAIIEEVDADLDRLSIRASRHTGEHFSLRWILIHMIEEYARHNGHADLLREAIDGVTGE